MHNIMTIVKKEFKDILRDRKTLVMTLLVPIVIMPLIFTFIFSNIGDMANPDEDNKYKIILDSNDENIVAMFDSIPVMEVTKDKGQSAIDKAYDGDVSVFVEVDENFQEKILNNEVPSINLYYDTSSQKAMTVAEVVQGLFTNYQMSYVSNILKENNLPEESLTPYTFNVIAKDETVDSMSAMLLGMLIPMMLIGYSVNGITPIAADLGAGEKERGTFEPLLSTGVSRNAILIGKLIVVSTFGIITSVFSTLGIFGALQFGLGDSMISINISIPNAILIMLLTSLYAIFMSALMLTVSTFARSLKEANTYLVPFSLVPIFLSMVTMYTDASAISEYMLHIPVLNVVCIIKEVIVNQLNYTHLYIVTGWSIAYVIISMIIARTMYEREEIIFRT